MVMIKKVVYAAVFFTMALAPVNSQEVSVYVIGAGDPAGLRNSVFTDLLGDGLTFLENGQNVTIPGLGYEVTFAADNAETREAALNHDVIIVIESAGSGAVMQLADIDRPILIMEIFLFLGTATRSGSLFLGPEAALNCCPEGDFEMEITDNSHPITSIYQVGQILQVSQNESNAQVLGLNPDMMAESAVSLAQAGLTTTPNAPWVALAVLPEGATGLVGDAGVPIPAGSDPTPDKRAFLGYQERVHIFTNEPMDELDIAISSEGAILFQRTVQWLAGEPVTAGGNGTAVSDWSVK